MCYKLQTMQSNVKAKLGKQEKCDSEAPAGRHGPIGHGSVAASALSADFLGFLSFRLRRISRPFCFISANWTYAESWDSKELFCWSSLIRWFSFAESTELILLGFREGLPFDANHFVFEKSSRATGKTGIKGWWRAIRIHPRHEVSDGMNWSANSSN